HDNPLEVVERVAATNGWSFERAGEDEITILVAGKWSDYQVSYTWMFDIEALHLACAFELKVPERRRGEGQQLISLINEQMWVGISTCGSRTAWSCTATRWCWPAASRRRAGSARRCSQPRSMPASGTSPPFNSWSGRASRRVRRSTPPCSTPRGKRKLATNARVTRGQKRVDALMTHARFKTWMPTELGLARVPHV